MRGTHCWPRLIYMAPLDPRRTQEGVPGWPPVDMCGCMCPHAPWYTRLSQLFRAIKTFRTPPGYLRSPIWPKCVLETSGPPLTYRRAHELLRKKGLAWVAPEFLHWMSGGSGLHTRGGLGNSGEVIWSLLCVASTLLLCKSNGSVVFAAFEGLEIGREGAS